MAAHKAPKGPVPLARLAGRVLGPVTAKRGFAKADLIAAWDEVAGPRYAAVTQPEKLQWPRDGSPGAVLTVRVGGPQGVYLQHERQQFIDRVNGFLGYAAVRDLRIVQRPLSAPLRRSEAPALPPAAAASIAATVSAVESDGLRAALARLGSAIAAERLARA